MESIWFRHRWVSAEHLSSNTSTRGRGSQQIMGNASTLKTTECQLESKPKPGGKSSSPVYWLSPNLTGTWTISLTRCLVMWWGPRVKPDYLTERLGEQPEFIHRSSWGSGGPRWYHQVQERALWSRALVGQCWGLEVLREHWASTKSTTLQLHWSQSHRS